MGELDERGILSRSEAETQFSKIHDAAIEIDAAVSCILVGMCADQLTKPGRLIMQDIRAESFSRDEGKKAAAELVNILKTTCTIIMWPHCCMQYHSKQQEAIRQAYPRITFVFPEIKASATWDLAVHLLGEHLASLNLMRLKPIDITRAA